MKHFCVFIFTAIILPAILLLSGCSSDSCNTTVSSPDGTITLQFSLDKGKPSYSVSKNGNNIITSSALGFVLKENGSLKDHFTVLETKTASFDEWWEPVWGTDKKIRNDYNELTVCLKEDTLSERSLTIQFRAFNDGVAFRYIFPEQESLGEFNIMSEETEFTLAGDYKSWWILGDWNSYEELYSTSLVSKIDTIHTPVTFESGDSLFISIHEANLTDYASMTLVGDGSTTLTSELVPWPDGIKVKAKTPFQSPWRTIQIADKPGKLVESHLILNLNEPSVIEDPSWIKPMTYVGIWWGMHLNLWTWSADNNPGATTERAKQYIDFAAKHNIGGVLVEGWNQGWESWFSADKFSFTESYEFFDLEEVANYAKEKGVMLIGHHETGGGIPSYEAQIDDAFDLYEKLGVHAVKTGYAGKIRPEEYSHHGQWMVRHYRMVVQKAAEHKIMIDAHEPIKATGIERTYPNMMTREGVQGMEYNAWSSGNPPDHTTIIPFTRMLAGPIDYTPGIFDIHFKHNRDGDFKVHTTLAKQLALYIIIFSPMQMAADLVENYEGHPAFTFIEHVPTTWDESHVLDAVIGDYVVTARKKDSDWYLGSITDEEERTITTELSFLDENTTYIASIYRDADDAHYSTNPTAYVIEETEYTSNDAVAIPMAPGGGYVIRFEVKQ